MSTEGATELFNAEVARLRDSGALGRSDVLARLFDYLAERSLAGDPPKEAEVAIAVFGKEGGFDSMQDASVRVAVLRLRRKLEEHYAATGETVRLFIPKGEYRLALAQPEAEVAAPDAAPLPARQHNNPARALLAAAILLFAISAIGWTLMLLRPAGAVAEAASMAPWSSLDHGQPTYVVVGDYYIFGENGPSGEVSRLVREFAINSKDDLDTYLMSNPKMMGRYVDVGLSYLPRGTAAVMGAIQPMVRPASMQASGRPGLAIVPGSALTAQRIRDGNVIYVGWLSGLGLLREPVFAASNFEVGSTYDELIDRTNYRHYAADWDQTDQRRRHRDYGYFASMPGPGGHPIIVIAGLRDAGLIQMSDVVGNPDELKRLAAMAKSPAFEALYEVQTLDNTNIAHRLVAVHALKTQGMWDRIGSHFPDQLNPDGGH